MRWTLAAALLLCVPALADAKDKIAPRLAALLASTGGETMETAYKVVSVDEEYQILRSRNFEPTIQSLVMAADHHPYDMIEATDDTGKKRTIWFDIASFYARGF